MQSQLVHAGRMLSDANDPVINNLGFRSKRMQNLADRVNAKIAIAVDKVAYCRIRTPGLLRQVSLRPSLSVKTHPN